MGWGLQIGQADNIWADLKEGGASQTDSLEEGAGCLACRQQPGITVPEWNDQGRVEEVEMTSHPSRPSRANSG